MNITDFLMARIAEDEKVAVDLRDQYPYDPGPAYLVGRWDEIEIAAGWRRVLADCEAKRRIVEAFARDLARDPDSANCDGDGGPWLAHRVARSLATVYADHPDYDQDWDPRA